MLTYFLNGSKHYPGARQIKKKSDGEIYDCDIIREKGYIPQNGDVLYRNIITGDSSLFNRMPSLFHCSVSTHRIVVNINDPNSLTFKMNVLACKPYNADFDGDEMNLIFGRTLMSRIEMLETSTIKRWFINYKDGGTPINIAGDSIITGFEMSKDSSKFCKGIMLRYFGNTTIIPDVSSDDENKIYSGKEIISNILPNDINYESKPSWFQDNLVPYIKYTDDEKKTVVVNGKIIKGVVDKNFAGLFRDIYFKYNSTKALTCLYNY
jgi:DNA-directed RNA polymerase subunit A'